MECKCRAVGSVGSTLLLPESRIHGYAAVGLAFPRPAAGQEQAGWVAAAAAAAATALAVGRIQFRMIGMTDGRRPVLYQTAQVGFVRRRVADRHFDICA